MSSPFAFPSSASTVLYLAKAKAAWARTQKGMAAILAHLSSSQIAGHSLSLIAVEHPVVTQGAFHNARHTAATQTAACVARGPTPSCNIDTRPPASPLADIHKTAVLVDRTSSIEHADNQSACVRHRVPFRADRPSCHQRCGRLTTAARQRRPCRRALWHASGRPSRPSQPPWQHPTPRPESSMQTVCAVLFSQRGLAKSSNGPARE